MLINCIETETCKTFTCKKKFAESYGFSNTENSCEASYNLKGIYYLAS